MDERREKQEAVRDELRQLGANLRAAIHEAWESDERRRLHVEIASGLEEAAATLPRRGPGLRRQPGRTEAAR